jgi:glutathione S-transferase
MVPWEQAGVDAGIKRSHARAAVLEKRLADRKYIALDAVSLADVFIAVPYWRCSQFVRRR